jgi:hypothetical protein
MSDPKVRPLHELIKAWIKIQSKGRDEDYFDPREKKRTVTWVLLLPSHDVHHPEFVKFSVIEKKKGPDTLVGPLKREWQFTSPLGIDGSHWLEQLADNILTDHETNVLVEQMLNWMVAAFGERKVYLAAVKRLSEELEKEHPYFD